MIKTVQQQINIQDFVIYVKKIIIQIKKMGNAKQIKKIMNLLNAKYQKIIYVFHLKKTIIQGKIICAHHQKIAIVSFFTFII